ncbi:MAG TPA: hypothetical protein VGN26_10105 [Armatimonadota bacterium]|jgi:hypothetical protein
MTGLPSSPTPDAEEFLNRCKTILVTFGLVFVPRNKNRQALSDLGLSIVDAKAIVLKLTPDCYVRGPDPDEDGSSGEVWVFGPKVGRQTIYVKLKLDGCIAKCLSFHPPERPLVAAEDEED